MKEKIINRETIEGYVYDHNLALKTVQNKESENFGKEFINGSIDVQTDEEGMNVVTVYYTYVTPTTKTGASNSTYTVLKKIMDEGKTVVTAGKDGALKVKLSPSLALNDFYTNRNGKEELISAKRNEGGFANLVNTLTDDLLSRNRFEADMAINGFKVVEADEERNITEHGVLKGAIFNFRGAILPVEFTIRSKKGMEYFESLDASPTNIVFTKVWGQITSQTLVDRREEESAFGEPVVKEYTKTVREYAVTGANPEPYEFGDEKTLTMEDIKKAMADRETYLADVKKRAEEYQAQKAAAPTATNAASAPAAAGGFNF